MSFKRFDPQDVVISAESISTPIWSGNITTLNSFATSSTQIGGPSGEYYFNVFQSHPSSSSARVQFSVTYGNKDGNGSLLYNPIVPGKSPSSTIYGQYRSLVLGDEDTDFSFGNIPSDHFFAISIDRARYKEKLLPGTLDLVLKYQDDDLTIACPNLNGSGNAGNKDFAEIRLTDNSQVASTVTFTDAGREYELVSGSMGSVYTESGNRPNGYTSNKGSYGKLYPDIGVIILNANALMEPSNAGGLELPVLTDANQILHDAAAATGEQNNKATNIQLGFDLFEKGGSFRIQGEETVSSNFVFVRARNNEFNYSSNPSLITGSGEIRHNVMINSPQSYVTSVGLYNDNNDLLAIAKLSRPLLKDFTKESLIRVKLDY